MIKIYTFFYNILLNAPVVLHHLKAATCRKNNTVKIIDYTVTIPVTAAFQSAPSSATTWLIAIKRMS